MPDLLDVTNEGYAALRDHIARTWTHLAVFRNIGAQTPTELLRLTEADPRLTREVQGKIIHFKLHLKGDDPEINASDTNVVPINGSGIFRADQGDDAMSLDHFDRFQFRNPADEITIHHSVHVPGGQAMIDQRRVSFNFDPGAYRRNTVIAWPGVAPDTHRSWCSVERNAGDFFGDQRDGNRMFMFIAGCDIREAGKVEVICYRNFTGGEGDRTCSVNVFVVEQPTT